jgi:hypothetical protein
MSVRAEWFHLPYTGVSAARRGVRYGDGRLEPGEVGVVIEADEAAVIYGDRAALLHFAAQLTAAAEAAVAAK